MRLKAVPWHDVEAALGEARGNWEETDKFNTHLHSHEEITAVVPESDELRHVKPDLNPGFFQHWVQLIMSSQGVSDEEWHVFELPRFLVREITDTCQAWCGRGELTHATIEDLNELFPKKTRAGVPTEEVFKDGRKWFLRVDACSAKDSAARSSVVTSAQEIIERTCTSLRAAQGFQDIIDDEKDPFQKANVFLVPFNDKMDPSREYRVFCPPLVGGIAAISQYRWHKPFAIVDSESAGLARRVQRVYEGAVNIYDQIARHAERLDDASVGEKMRTQGFSFDVLETLSGEIQLVEINPFGAMSGCGSCLFHWLRDANILYGLEERVEVRIVI